MPALEREQVVALMRRLYHCEHDKGVTVADADAGRAAPPPNPLPPDAPGGYRAYLALAGQPTAPQPTDSP